MTTEELSIPGSSQPPQEGFARRLLFEWCDKALKGGCGKSGVTVNDRRLSESEMHSLVEYARRHGFLK